MPWSRELLEFAYQLGLSIGSSVDSVVLGRDFRLTGDSLASIIAGALTAAGADVFDCGTVPTPTLAYAAKEHDMGIMVTASHNPPEYNGIKLWNPDGSALIDEQISTLVDGKVTTWDSTGRIKRKDALRLHKDALLKEFSEIPLKIVVDCANGATSVITPHILRELGADVITINCHPSGYFPGHPSEPSEENLEGLKRMVLRTGADLGIAHDGDGDRFIAITSKGRYLNGDTILAVFTKILGFSRIVAPVDSSMLLENFAQVVRVKVGDANVSRAMKEMGIEFGGENSGTQIFSSWRYTPDAIYAALKFAELASREDVEEIISQFPEYHTVRRSIRYQNREVVERKVEEFLRDYQVDRVDGYRVSLEDGWFLIRFSGTEPKVRITAEFNNREKAEKVVEEIISHLKE